MLVLLIVVVLCGAVVAAVRHPQWVLPSLIALGVLVSRPSAFGERWPLLGPVIIAGCAALCLARAVRRREWPQEPVPWPFLLFAVAWIRLGTHRVIVPASEQYLATSVFTWLIPVAAFYLVVRDAELLDRVRRALVAAITGVSVLTVLSILGMLAVGTSAIYLGALPVGYVGGDSDFYLPGSLSYGADPGLFFPRMLGLGREPGMGGLFIGWAFFAMPRATRYRRLWQAALIGALVATQSTAGIGLFGACWLLSILMSGARVSPFKAIFALAGGLTIVYLSVYSPDFGIVAKADSSGESVPARTVATEAGIEALVERPFTTNSTADLSSVNLIASIAPTGAPWFFLMGAFLLAPVFRLGRRRRECYGALFIFLIMLTSQPLSGNVIIFVLVLIDYYIAGQNPDRPRSDDSRNGEPDGAARAGPLGVPVGRRS